MIKRLSLFPILVTFLLIAGCSADKKEQTRAQAKATDALPHDPYSVKLHAASRESELADFETELLSGELFRLSEQKGKVVLINIWATWCAPCEEETPALVDLYEKYRNRSVEFIGISIDEQGRSVVEPFVRKHDVSYPITIDDGHIMEKYGPLMGVPTTYIVGREGNLRYFATGALTKAEIEPRLQKLLNE